MAILFAEWQHEFESKLQSNNHVLEKFVKQSAYRHLTNYYNTKSHLQLKHDIFIHWSHSNPYQMQDSLQKLTLIYSLELSTNEDSQAIIAISNKISRLQHGLEFHNPENLYATELMPVFSNVIVKEDKIESSLIALLVEQSLKDLSERLHKRSLNEQSSRIVYFVKSEGERFYFTLLKASLVNEREFNLTSEDGKIAYKCDDIRWHKSKLFSANVKVAQELNPGQIFIIEK